MTPGALEEAAWSLIAVGLFLLVGYAAHVLGRRAHVPRVTLLLAVGVVAGPRALGLAPASVAEWFPVVSEVALSMVGFMLGERFSREGFRSNGKLVLGVAVAETLGAAAFVFVGLLALGVPIELALLFAGVAPASAPAATVDVVRESKAAGPLTDTVLGVVAVDDAFGIVLFTGMLMTAQLVGGSGVDTSTLAHAAWEVFGGVLIGLGLGLPMAWLSGRVRPGELTLVETLGFVLLCGGVAAAVGASFLIASMSLGATVANRAKHHHRPFHAIKGISQPFLIVFFLVAGMEFDFSEFVSLGLIGVGYFVLRAGGKVAASYLGTRAIRAPLVVRRYVGWCLLPQAGVALGLGLVAAQRFPQYGAGLLAVLIGTTFLFEIVGPISTRWSLRLAGELGRAGEESSPT